MSYGRKKEIYLAEPYLEVSVKVINGWYKENLVLVGIKEDSKLYSIHDEAGKPIRLLEEGIIYLRFGSKN